MANLVHSAYAKVFPGSTLEVPLVQPLCNSPVAPVTYALHVALFRGVQGDLGGSIRGKVAQVFSLIPGVGQTGRAGTQPVFGLVEPMCNLVMTTGGLGKRQVCGMAR